MTRLTATTQLDMKVQLREKIYHISIGMAVIIGLAIRFIFPAESIPTLLPLFYLFAIGGTAYIFVAGLVMFEKGERTLAAQIVSPLRVDEYLWAKALSLLVVVLIESTIVLLLGAGIGGYNPLPLYVGVILMSLGLTFGGFVQASRYDSVTDFLVPAVIVLLILQLPWLALTGLVESPLWYLIPTMAPTLLMQAAFQPIATWELLYGFGYSILWIVILFLWARRAYYRNIVLKGA